jgi:hypothetical protein
MTNKIVKLRATVSFIYEAESDNYGTDDPKMMAAIDKVALTENPVEFIDGITNLKCNIEYIK